MDTPPDHKSKIILLLGYDQDGCMVDCTGDTNGVNLIIVIAMYFAFDVGGIPFVGDVSLADTDSMLFTICAVNGINWFH